MTPAPDEERTARIQDTMEQLEWAHRLLSRMRAKPIPIEEMDRIRMARLIRTLVAEWV